MKTLVLIPTYNERENLPLLVADVLAVPGTEILVIDDQSPDGTGQIAEELASRHPGRVRVMHRTGRRGLGVSYLDGFRHAVGSDADLVVQMDADRSHDPQYLPAMIAATASADLVVGSRYLHGISVVNWPLRRIILSSFANVYIRSVTGLGVNDCTTGYRCWRREALARLPLDRIVSEGYSFVVEVTFLAAVRGPAHRRVADHLHRAARGRLQAVVGHPARVAGHAVAAGAATRARARPAAPAPRDTIREVRRDDLPADDPSLTVFFPAYNDSGTIASLVISAVQTASTLTPDYEVLVINDGSQDETAHILDELARVYPEHVRIVHHVEEPGLRRRAALGLRARVEGPGVLHRRRRAVRPDRDGGALGPAHRRRGLGERLEDQPLRSAAPDHHRAHLPPHRQAAVRAEGPRRGL